MKLFERHPYFSFPKLSRDELARAIADRYSDAVVRRARRSSMWSTLAGAESWASLFPAHDAEGTSKSRVPAGAERGDRRRVAPDKRTKPRMPGTSSKSIVLWTRKRGVSHVTAPRVRSR